jgi:hypothetical protein
MSRALALCLNGFYGVSLFWQLQYNGTRIPGRLSYKCGVPIIVCELLISIFNGRP